MFTLILADLKSNYALFTYTQVHLVIVGHYRRQNITIYYYITMETQSEMIRYCLMVKLFI